jgi:hypothetical protein
LIEKTNALQITKEKKREENKVAEKVEGKKVAEG